MKQIQLEPIDFPKSKVKTWIRFYYSFVNAIHFRKNVWFSQHFSFSYAQFAQHRIIIRGCKQEVLMHITILIRFDISIEIRFDVLVANRLLDYSY
jgi:hypothetical protein